MTTLAVIGDVHAHRVHLRQVLEHVASRRVEGVLLVGDVADAGWGAPRQRDPANRARYEAELAEMLATVRSLGHPVLWVPGNHDYPDPPADPGNVDGSVQSIGDLRVAGVGGAGPDLFGFAYEWSEEAIARRVVPPCDVLLCHAPPRDTPLDFVPKVNRHVGSRVLRERALVHAGVYVCGHIHESAGFVRLGACLCLNVGGLGEPFGRPRVGYVHGVQAVELVDLVTGQRRVWERT